MEHTIALIEQSQEGDKKARDQLVEENLGLVWCVVRRFMGRGYDSEDLFQIGSIGLIKAIDKFDLSFEVKFSTYAVPMISGEIKRFLRDDGMIKVSRSLKENAYKAHMTRERFNQQLGRDPTLEEIAEEIGASKEELVMALESNVEVESLYKTIYQQDGNPIYLMDKIEEDEDREEKVLNRMVLEQVLDGLPEKEQEIIRLRYFGNKTQTEIAEKLGISQVQVSRMEKKILKGLREKLQK